MAHFLSNCLFFSASRMWDDVTNALKINDIENATAGKHKVQISYLRSIFFLNVSLEELTIIHAQ